MWNIKLWNKMKLLDMTGAWFVQSEDEENIKIGELLIEPHFHMLLYVHYENNKPRAFALFEPKDDAVPETTSHRDFILSTPGHFDAHEDCELDWESFCRITFAKQLDLSIFLMAIQFDHPLAVLEPLDPVFILQPDPCPSSEKYWSILHEIQLGY